MSSPRMDLDGGGVRAQYREGDLVLYRDPVLYLSGADGHTGLFRVSPSTDDQVAAAHFGVSLRLVSVVSSVSTVADPQYVRRLDPAVVMRDIDTAPLHVPGLLSAAEAWLSNPEAGDR